MARASPKAQGLGIWPTVRTRQRDDTGRLLRLDFVLHRDDFAD
jgi:hypothetical protein